MNKSLLSVGVLDSIGCSISVREGVMKITKGSMVIIKGQKKGTLYKLIGDTVAGGVAIFAG